MASLRNAIKRREHKERSQPAKRRKLGLLEKHKDYVERARDYGRKKERITKLKKKAAFRNPDEFYHKMSSSTTAGGVHKQGTAAKDRNSKSFIDEEEINADIRALAHTQDMSYVQMKRMQEIKKIEKLEAGLHCLGEEFEGSEEEVQSFSAAKHFDTEEELAGRKHNRPRKKDLRSKEFAKATIAPKDPRKLKAVEKKRESAYRELEQRKRRVQQLDKALDVMQTRKNLTGKGRRRKVRDAKGDRPAVFKWKQERKR